LGSTKSGTLSLENSDAGLLCRCELPNTSYANDLYEIISRGDVKTMSFGFSPVKWEDGNNRKMRTLKEVSLHEVSFGVSFPAYPETNSIAELRSITEMNIDVEQLNNILGKNELIEEDVNFINDIIAKLRDVIKTDEPQENEPEHTTQEETSTQEEEIQKRKVQLLIDIENLI
jgi:hypothetical protein